MHVNHDSSHFAHTSEVAACSSRDFIVQNDFLGNWGREKERVTEKAIFTIMSFPRETKREKKESILFRGQLRNWNVHSVM